MRSWAIALALVAAFAIARAQAQTAPPPVEAFGRLPAVADAAISPDGTKIVMAATTDAGQALTVVDLERRATIARVAVDPVARLRAVGWADDARATFIISQAFAPNAVLPYYVRFRGAPRRVEYERPGIFDVASQRTRLFSSMDQGWADQGSTLIVPIEGEPNTGRLIGTEPGGRSLHANVYRVDLLTANARSVQPRGTNNNTVSFILDERGAPAARYDRDDATDAERVFVYDGDTPRLLLDGDAADVSLVGLLTDGRLAVIGPDADDRFQVLSAIDRATGQREVLVSKPGYDIDDAILDPWTRRVVGATWTEQETKQQFFDPALQAASDRIVALFRGSGRILSWSRDRRRVLAYGERGLDGGGYYVYTPADDHADMISYRYPELARAQSGERQAITFRARDGTRIPAYLTIPSGGGDHRPLVILVHGGPGSRDTMDFDWWASFLASRGYVVLQPNFRGSTGYGSEWTRAGYGGWGGVMQTDVDDGMDALARAGMIDPHRVCIVGASYGGYSALAGATLTPDRYRCAVSVAGPSDLNAMLRQNEAQSGADSASSDYWRTSIGDRREDAEYIRSISPAMLADRVTVPVLLIHGTDDSVVPLMQSQRMRDRLNAAGKQVRYVELRGDDHWLSDAPTRIQMLREIETFLGQSLAVTP